MLQDKVDEVQSIKYFCLVAVRYVGECFIACHVLIIVLFGVLMLEQVSTMKQELFGC